MPKTFIIEKMEFSELYSSLQEKRNQSYLKCSIEQKMDPISFNNYPISIHNKLKSFYSEAQEIFVVNGFWDRLTDLNNKITDDLKKKYSDFDILPNLRMLYKWLGMDSETTKEEDIEVAEEFLANNWLFEDFLPFIPIICSKSALIDRDIVCRLSGSESFCISFTYYRGGLKHFRFLYDTKEKILVPWSKEDVERKLSFKTIKECKEMIYERVVKD